jgi:hypothetical protein
LADNDHIIPILMELKDQVARADATSRLEHAANQKRLDEIAARLQQTNADLAENCKIASGNSDKIRTMIPHVEVLAKKKAVRDAIKAEAATWAARITLFASVVTPLAGLAAWLGGYEPVKRFMMLFR